MKSFLKENNYYIYPFLLFLVLGMIPFFTLEKGDVILYFSEHRSVFGDFFFKYATKLGEEILYVAITIALLFVRYRYALLIPITGIIVTIFSFALKTFFATPRPATFFKQEGVWNTINTIDGVDLYTGMTSFPSGHTMSGFALYGILAFMLAKNKWKWTGILFFILSFLVGFSRVYIVQHFWQDIYAGATIGVVLAIIIYQLQKRIPNRPNHWLDKSILTKKKSTTNISSKPEKLT